MSKETLSHRKKFTEKLRPQNTVLVNNYKATYITVTMSTETCRKLQNRTLIYIPGLRIIKHPNKSIPYMGKET